MNAYGGVSLSFTTRVQDLLRVSAALDGLPDEIRKSVKRDVMKRAGEAVADAAKPYAPDVTGTTKRAIGVVVRQYSDAEKTIAVVGIRRGYKTQVVWPGRKKARSHDPAWIAHLIEDGWRVAKGGTLMREGSHKTAKSSVTGQRGMGVAVGYVQGRHVMRNALLQTRSQVTSIITDGVWKAINEALARLGKTG